MIHGGCFCKKIRFTIEDGDYLVVNCHCTMCRKTSAAPFVTWIVVARNTFEYTCGEPKLLKSSARGSRQFCPDCGTPLTFSEQDRPDNIDVTTGSLDQPDDFPPSKAVHEESKLAWLHQTE